ncbi:hypothetical protein OHB26_33545 [Nocardia sp. NBC_01503]|uniref:hypothetical protein n=1 Tax=Nocardia sp. NBC_01503 TaxID=2975997 RepID=UPI002E7B4157|nr:hypothetical protein [Nocardia sp. NBC_01503]WTL31776.1 hypothetical protein OHB26_33545 [Nocardia sp. NBC_01503]
MASATTIGELVTLYNQLDGESAYPEATAQALSAAADGNPELLDNLAAHLPPDVQAALTALTNS